VTQLADFVHEALAGMFEEVRVPAVWTVAHRGYSGNRRLDVWIYRDENTALRAAAELAMSCGVARTTTRRPTKAPGTPPPLSAPTSSAELDTATDADAEAGVWEEGSPSGSAAPVVKRGPNAGSRFRLDQPVTSAGRHPDSDIFLDDVSVSRRHAEFRRENGEYLVVDTASLNGTYFNREPVESAQSSTN
jgi:FHA domain